MGKHVISWIQFWLVIEPAPLKHMNSSVGMMTFPTEGKNKMHVPNHQPATFDRMNLGLLGHFPNWYDEGKVWTHLENHI